MKKYFYLNTSTQYLILKYTQKRFIKLFQEFIWIFPHQYDSFPEAIS